MAKAKSFPLNIIVDQPYDDANVDFLSSAHSVFHEPAFQKVLKYLADYQVMHSATKAVNWESVQFDRASIHGINLIIEEFERLEGEYQQLHQRGETFNKHDVI